LQYRDDGHHDGPRHSRHAWRLALQWPTIALALVPIMTVDLALFGANTLKIPSGAGSRW